MHGNYYRFFNRDGALRQVNWQRLESWKDLGGGDYEVEYSQPLVAAVAVRIEAQRI